MSTNLKTLQVYISANGPEELERKHNCLVEIVQILIDSKGPITENNANRILKEYGYLSE